jgi:membrane protease YdiL (CAAX protease family)
VVEAILPSLSTWGSRIVLNWLLVVLAVGLVAWLGWWREIRLTAPIAPGARRFLLPLVAFVVVPFVAAVTLVPAWFAVPEYTVFAGRPLSAVGVALFVVVGIALGAALQEELLFRGVALRALEPRGRLLAAVASSLLFGAGHLSLLVVDVPVTEVLVVTLLNVVTGVGLAAITFRLGTLWPLVGWHLFQNFAPSYFTTEAVVVYAVADLGLSLVVAVAGVWLLWGDRAGTDTDAERGARPVSSD